MDGKAVISRIAAAIAGSVLAVAGGFLPVSQAFPYPLAVGVMLAGFGCLLWAARKGEQ